MKRITSRIHLPSVVAGMAIIIMVTGTAYAASQIDSGDVKNGSLTGKDVKNKSLSKADFKGSVAGAQGPQGPQGAQGPAGSALAYAHVEADGTQVAGESKNVTSVVKPSGTNGLYCFDLAVPAVNAVVTLEGFYPGEVVVRRPQSISLCPPGPTDYEVTIFNSAGSAPNSNDFYVAFN